MNINQLRIDTLRALIGNLKSKEFADRYNIDPSYLSQLLNGHRPLGDRAAKKLEDKIGLTGGTLLMPARLAQDGVAPGIEPGPIPMNPFRRAPLQGVAQLSQDGTWDELAAGTGWVDAPTSDPTVYSVRIKGNALAPAIRNGWIIWCEPRHDLVPGEYVLVTLTDGTKMVKELLYENDEEVSLMAVNDTYSRLTVTRAEIESIHYVGGISPPSQLQN